MNEIDKKLVLERIAYLEEAERPVRGELLYTVGTSAIMGAN